LFLSLPSDQRRGAEDAMKRISLAVLIVGSACMLDSIAAVAGGLPFCLKGCDVGAALGDCSFASYQQCQATASGRDAWCDANPFFHGNGEAQPSRHNYSRRRF
jgi:Protein of unknown function (DUF3551)